MKSIFLKMYQNDCFGLLELTADDVKTLKKAKEYFYGGDIKPRWVALDIGNINLMRDEDLNYNEDFEKTGFVVVEERDDLLFINGQDSPFVEFGYNFDCDVDFLEFNDSGFWVRVNVEESRGDTEYYSTTIPWRVLDELN